MIGIGNELRGDDAAGLQVARRLRAGEPGVAVREHAGEAVDLLEMWRGADAVVLVDAVRSGAPPGTVHRIDASAEPIPAALSRTSSHAISAAEAIELGRALGRLPATVVVYGIEGCQYLAGAALSESIAPAIDAVANAVRQEARSLAQSLP